MDREIETGFIAGIFLGFFLGFCAAFIWRLLIEKKANDSIVKKIDSIIEITKKKKFEIRDVAGKIEWPENKKIKETEGFGL
jgi:gas vesicle protein